MKHGAERATITVSQVSPLGVFSSEAVHDSLRGEIHMPRPARSFHSRVVLAALASTLLSGLLAAPAWGIGSILEVHEALPDIDQRPGHVAPSAAQKAAVEALGAHAFWNDYGTPSSLINYDGYLATGLSSDPIIAARTFI